MPALGFPLGAPLGGGGAVIAPALPQSDADALRYTSDLLGVLPDDDTGTDVSLFDSVNGTWPVRGGDLMFAEQLLRRLTSRRGQLDFSQNDGIDVRDELREDMTADDVFHAKQKVENELLKDERVDDADVLATYDPSRSSLTLGMTVTKGAGAFRLVVAVTALTVDLLSAEVV